MYVHAALARGLSELGVDTIFGILGDANLFMVDDWVRNHGGRYVSSANEEGAVLMANGYASTTGRLGVATVTHGPALTNTLTALAEVVKNQVPLLLIAGDTAVDDKLNLQSLPTTSWPPVPASSRGVRRPRSSKTSPSPPAAPSSRAVRSCSTCPSSSSGRRSSTRHRGSWYPSSKQSRPIRRHSTAPWASSRRLADRSSSPAPVQRRPRLAPRSSASRSGSARRLRRRSRG